MAMAQPRQSTRDRALLTAASGTGQVTGPAAVVRGLVDEGLAAAHGHLGHAYLTAAGWAARRQLEQPRVSTRAEPSEPSMLGEGGIFPARVGEEQALSDDEEAARAAELAETWHALLHLRTFQTGEPRTPAPWEREKPLRAVALTLEAGGIPPAAMGPNKAYVRAGYVALPGGEAPVRVEWRGPSATKARNEAGQRLTECENVLRAAGWHCLQYSGAKHARWLRVSDVPI